MICDLIAKTTPLMVAYHNESKTALTIHLALVIMSMIQPAHYFQDPRPQMAMGRRHWIHTCPGYHPPC